MSMEIRPEIEADHPDVREVNRLTFGGEQGARLVDDLRDAGYARLSLVAVADGRVIGRIMLGAASMIPDRQGEGTGSALTRDALDRCAASGHRIVVLLGHPGYYPRFGFSAGLAKNLSSSYSGGAFLALELVPGALPGVSGKFAFAPPFGAAS